MESFDNISICQCSCKCEETELDFKIPPILFTKIEQNII